LIEAMRDIGYSLETALADIIDNSITADAGKIQILFDARSSQPSLAVLDDGNGMSSKELIAAMRPGSRSPLEDRSSADLGRFGLGLKTASFSQCRSLTVVTRQSGKTHAARWDLDYVAEKDDWLLQQPPAFDLDSVPFYKKLGPKGTLIVWEKLDRLADRTSGSGLADHILDRLDSARRHLELVFHRFLDGERGLPRVRILMNGSSLVPFDPFHSRHPATQRLARDEIKVDGRKVIVEPYVLPHHGKVSPQEWDRYAGEGGYSKNQGFYLYRGGRLIIHGTWFRLARQTELTKLARVKVEMPNGLDHLWKIDVKKAFAQPPFVVRERLRRIIEQIATPAKRVYTARGQRLVADSAAVLWHRRVDKGRISYEINRDHPMLRHLIEELPDERGSEIETLLKGIERAFPVDAVFSDAAGDPTQIEAPPIPPEELSALIGFTVRVFLSRNIDVEGVLSELHRTEPYRSAWSTAEPLIRKIYEEQQNAL
jgi:hypothetical protein